MKILIVEPTNNWASVYNHAKIPRLGPLRIAAEAKQMGHTVIVYSEAISGPLMKNWGLVDWADKIGFSFISAFAPDTYQLVKMIRQDNANRGKIIIGGGVHPSFAEDEALDNGFNVIFKGPASLTFRNFLQGGGNDLNIKGISYKDNDGKIIHNEPAPQREDLDSLPPPAYEVLYRPKKLPIGFSATIECIRSCPHRCEFCTVWKMLGPVVMASPETAVRDAQAIQKAFGPVSVFMADDNFPASRERSLAIAEAINKAIKDKRLQPFGGLFQCSIKMPLDAEYLKALQPVWKGVAVGLEDLRSQSYKKRGNLADVERFFAVLSERGFHIHAMLIIQPDMTWTEVRNTVGELRRLGAKSAQFTVLTPLLGSDLWYELVRKGELDPKGQDWRRFNTFNPVSCYPVEMGDKMNYAWVAFNSPCFAIGNMVGMLGAGVDFKTSVFRFISNLAIWHSGMRWSWQNRGWKGLLRAVKWSI